MRKVPHRAAVTGENGQFCRRGLDAYLGPGSGLARELQAYAPLRRHRARASARSRGLRERSRRRLIEPAQQSNALLDSSYAVRRCYFSGSTACPRGRSFAERTAQVAAATVAPTISAPFHSITSSARGEQGRWHRDDAQRLGGSEVDD